MRILKLAHILRFAIVICYSLTIPVLSVYHHHGTIREANQVLHSNSGLVNPVEQNSPYCTICLQVASSNTFQPKCFHLSETFVPLTSLSPEIVPVSPSPDPVPIQARAPPPESI